MWYLIISCSQLAGVTSRPQLAELSGRQFHENIFLEDELEYFFLRFYWDVCLFTLVKPIIMGGVVFTSP